jgi:stage III sporulation protein AD
MDIVKIIIIGLMGGILAVFVKKYSPEYAFQVSLVTGLVILVLILDYLIYAVDFVKKLVAKYNVPFEYLTIVLKVIGIAYLSEFAVNLLKDVGENSIAAKVEIAAKIIIVVISLPLFSTFFDMIFGLMN